MPARAQCLTRDSKLKDAMAQWLWLTCSLALVVVAVSEISDEQYYSMPQLFHMDHYEACLSSPGGVYCLGSFEFSPEDNKEHALFQIMQSYSLDKNNFNRTLLHRGYCISSRCATIDATNPDFSERFTRCVNEDTQATYGLTARLTDLRYCKTRPQQRPVDALDTGFAYFIGLIVLVNVLATAYDVMLSQDSKPNLYVQAWSLARNWHTLTREHGAEGDPQLKLLDPIQGFRVLGMFLMVLGHSIFAQYMGYMYNPEFFEAAYKHTGTIIFLNGTSIVQTFFLISSFLMAYNMLRIEARQKRLLGFNMLPYCVGHRIVRLLPLHMIVVGATGTWWSRVGDGPLWGPLVEREEARCRTSWWAHALFINNFSKADDICLLHTWFVAADTQLYIFACALTLALIRWWRQSALKILSGLFVVAVLANFLMAYCWNLKSVVAISLPESVRVQYAGEPSFEWMYRVPWTSLPTTLLGLAFAFILHHVQQTGYNVHDNMLLRVLYNISIPTIFAWVFSGVWTKELTSPLSTSVGATLERPVFALILTVIMFGIITDIGYLWNRFTSCRCWQVLGRLSYSVYLVHWTFHLTQVAFLPHAGYMSSLQVIGHWLVTLLLTYLTALPVYLMIELPVQKFLNTLLFRNSKGT